MHGLIVRSVQSFVTDVYGAAQWQRVAARADLPTSDVEAMMRYADDVFARTVSAAAKILDKPVDGLLEDLGTYLVSHRSMGRIRRLLRFGGADFVEFIESLDDLVGRAHLAMPDLGLPAIQVRAVGPGLYIVSCAWAAMDLTALLTGALRAMADDYGALAMVDAAPASKGAGVRVTLLSSAFTPGRSFELRRARP
ncbi:heme NO-binding domain-containing protein [Palleronia pelagia]|uniref:Haem-NO-binding n=1 Tax=Palleronia pelagia TaxID=387096 RepID=A0A1H8IHK6_9RHOB|nr:heme NO-binding domain-containing protein [Palleronia pelagia]SEN67841.1 Haem-NO-binding [Palleronia pelagia]